MEKYSILVALLSIFFIFCKPPENMQQKKIDENKISNDTTDLNNNSDKDFIDWIKYDIEGLGEIYIPPELEIQEGKFKELTDKFREINGLTEKQIVFQQSGLNKFKKDAFASYARVIIKTQMEKIGDVGTLYDLPISDTELKEFDKLLKKQYELSFKITEWYPVKIVEVNGMSAILISYKRKIGDNPEAFVRIYQFHNYDRIHTITLSYRITEEDKWRTMFDKILSSLKIIEIK